MVRKAVTEHIAPPISEEHAEAWAAKEDRFMPQQTIEGYFLGGGNGRPDRLSG
jgi:hypothetical protein